MASKGVRAGVSPVFDQKKRDYEDWLIEAIHGRQLEEMRAQGRELYDNMNGQVVAQWRELHDNMNGRVDDGEVD
jgi:hypothetical protein